MDKVSREKKNFSLSKRHKTTHLYVSIYFRSLLLPVRESVGDKNAGVDYNFYS